MKILSPAGSLKKLFAGLKAGADAFYLGLEEFSARASAENFSIEELETASCVARIFKKELYITINTLLTESGIKSVRKILTDIYSYNIKGIIIQDFGLIEMLKTDFPDLKILASTQMSIHNLPGVKFTESEGFYQTILARELSCSDIEYIGKNSKINLETFIHGAMCYSYSGQCLISSMIGGRSGNKGRCAQICRKKYTLSGANESKPAYLMSTKDMSGIDHVKKIEKLGIDTIKIEGRLRSEEYVYSTADLYRNLLTEKKENLRDKINSSLISFNRGSECGFFNGDNLNIVNNQFPANNGIFLGKVKDVTKEMITITNQSSYLLKKGDGITIETAGRKFGFILTKTPQNTDKEIVISESCKQFRKDSLVYVTSEGRLRILKDYDNKIELTVKIEQIENTQIKITFPELNNFIKFTYEISHSGKDFRTLLSKKINNFNHEKFKLKLRDSDINFTPEIFIQYKQIREAINEILDQSFNKHKFREKTTIPQQKAVSPQRKEKIVSSRRKELIYIVDTVEKLEYLQNKRVNKIYLSFQFYEAHKDQIKADKQIYIILPTMIKDKFYDKISEIPKQFGVVAKNIGEIFHFSRQGYKVDSSFNLNITNSASALKIGGNGVDNVCLSLETDFHDFKFKQNINHSLFIFGYFPVMTTENCMIKTSKGCDRCKEKHLLKDERGEQYILKTNSLCQNEIFFYKPLFLGKSYNKIAALPITELIVNTEEYDFNEFKKIINYFENGLKSNNFQDKISINIKPFKGQYKF